MASIDIRNEIQNIEKIVFADTKALVKESIGSCPKITDTQNAIFLKSKVDAENLVKAVNKAIELGWWI